MGGWILQSHHIDGELRGKAEQGKDNASGKPVLAISITKVEPRMIRWHAVFGLLWSFLAESPSSFLSVDILSCSGRCTALF